MRQAGATFQKAQLEKLFEELRTEWQGVAEYERLVRDAHLAIALSDAGRPLDDIDARVSALVEKLRPRQAGA